MGAQIKQKEESEMAYRGTKIEEVAKEVAQIVIEAAEATGNDAYDIHIFLQNDMDHQEWESGHAISIPMYGIYCDHSYGGSKEAEAAVRERLPNALIIFANDKGEWLTEEEACEQAWGEIARKNGYHLIDFALGVSLVTEEIV